MKSAMVLLPRRTLLAIAAVVDVAIHARPTPVAAKSLAARHDLPPRHLETLLQDLVRAHVLKGVRGPKGGYELARERRRISVGDVVRASLTGQGHSDSNKTTSGLLEEVVMPRIEVAGAGFLAALDVVTIEDLCQAAEVAGKGRVAGGDFNI